MPLKTLLAALALSLGGLAAAAPVTAQIVNAEASVSTYETSGSFVRKAKKLSGDWSVVQRDGATYIVFADDFRAANGPDLKVFLSPKSVAVVTGETAIDGAVRLGELQRTKGTQEYRVPAGVNLAEYGSVLVHCEAYSVLWGGGDL